MNKFNGIDQKKKDRSTKEWIETLTPQERRRLNIPTNETLNIDTTAEVINHFSSFFKPNK